MPKPRAFRTAIAVAKKEATFGVLTSGYLTALNAANTWFACTEADFADAGYDLIDTSNEINGFSMPTDHTVQQLNGQFARKYYLSTELLAFYLALQLGNVTSVGPSSAVSEVQTITFGGATTGAFKLIFKGATTGVLDLATVTNATLQTALQALSTIGTGNATVSGTVAGGFVVTFASGLANTKQPLFKSVIYTAFDAGAVTVVETTPGGAAAVYTHTIQFPSECILNPPSAYMVEGLACGGSSQTYKGLGGCTVESLEVNIASKGFMDLVANLKFTGQEDDLSSGFTFQTAIAAMTRLTGNKITVFFGATTSTAVNALDVRAVKITQGSGLVTPPTINDSDLVPEYQFGEKKPDLAVELDVRGDKASTYYQFFQNFRVGTKYKFKIVVQPNVTPQASFTFTMNQVVVIAKMDKQGNETRLKLTLMAEANATDNGPCTWTCETPTPSYLNGV